MKDISCKEHKTKSPKSLESHLEDEECEGQMKPGESDESGSIIEDNYAVDLPLEVITTVQPFNYNYPILKNMSNGVLTHRNIFTEAEREILTRIVDKYRDIVDTRSRTREIYLEKQTVWQQIVEEYNSTENVIVRTEKELRKCWDNMKYRARLAVKEQIKTEGEKHETKTQVNETLERSMSGQSSGYSPGMSANNSDSREKEANGIYSDDTSSHNYSDEDDDEAPAFKKARQESPKLSSLLLGGGKVAGLLNTSPELGNYGAAKSTKISSHNRKKVKKNNSSLVNILPKGLASSVSVMNIPNPNHFGANASNPEFYNISSPDMLSGSINLGGGITISPQMNHSAAFENLMKPLPSLTRVCSRKNISNKGKTKKHDIQQAYQEGIGTTSKNELECKAILKRLVMEEKEHQLRMKLLEKKVQAFSSESQYWALKLKLLKSADVDVSSLTNGNGAA